MQVVYGFDKAFAMQRPVAAVGSFDGVHLGHCRILQYLVSCAQTRDAQSAVITFDPHPQQVLHPESGFKTINSLQKNLQLIEKQGVDVAVVVPFTKLFSELSYVDFVERYLIGKMEVGTIVMGPNHAIGHNREGSHQLLVNLCEQHQVEVVEIPELMLYNAGVHSAEIRKAIAARNWNMVDQMLGYHYEPSAE